MKRLKVTKSDDIFSFDLLRLTWLGWLLALLAIAVGIGLAVLTVKVLSEDVTRRYGVVGTVGVGGGILFFVVVKVLLGLAGVSVIKPAKEAAPRREEDSGDDDERRPRRHDDEYHDIRKSRPLRDEEEDDEPRRPRRERRDRDDRDEDERPRRRRARDDD
jgi:hypothetical protein